MNIRSGSYRPRKPKSEVAIRPMGLNRYEVWRDGKMVAEASFNRSRNRRGVFTECAVKPAGGEWETWHCAYFQDLVKNIRRTYGRTPPRAD